MPRKPQHIARTRFARDIVAEFLPPVNKTKSTKVVILCHGMPSVPNRRDLIEFFSNKGYWVFFPRYRGSWESDGSFLKISPHRDILDIINQLSKGFRNLSNNKVIKIKADKIDIIGGSFGGPAALLASKDPRVNKVIAISPVVDWQSPSKTEPLGPLFKYVKQAFGQGYRIKEKDWNKLRTGKFYNPIRELNKIDPKKVLLIHAKDDDVVAAKSVKRFAAITGSTLIMLNKGGHLNNIIITKPQFYPRIKKFLNS